MIWSLEHLGENVPAKQSNGFYGQLLRNTQTQLFNRLALMMIGLDRDHRLSPEQKARLEKMVGKRLEETASLVQLARTLSTADISTLRQRLQDENPAARKLAIQLIVKKRLALEGNLIDQLSDPILSSLAHDALVRLARGTDFGPTARMSQKQKLRCITKWRNWLALQVTARTEAAPKSITNRPASAK